MKRVVTTVTIICILIAYFFASTHYTFAQSLAETDKRLAEIRSKIADLEKQLEEARGKEKTLKSQLAYIDTQSSLTTLKIEETQEQIAKLEQEIGDLSGRITKLSTTVDKMTELLLNRIVQTYKYGSYTTIDLLFSSHGFTDLLLRAKYLQTVQQNDKKILYQLQATKAAYNDQKIDKETRQAEQERLKKQLERYQADLAEQKKVKEELLRITQNDEIRFQNLIAQLKAEEESITKAISNIGAVIGPVEKGQTIAAMGSTGCSTGPHLHFEVFENAKVENGRIVGTRTNPHNYLDNGKLGPPIRGYPDETKITADYGAFGSDYIPGWPPHTGIDIAPKSYEGVGRAILAAEKGVAYSTSAPCKNPPAGGSAVGKGVIVDHQNGIVTLYWHIL